MNISKISLGLVGLAMCLGASSAMAEEMKYMATLTGADEVPPVMTDGKGMVSAMYDTSTKKLTWTTESSGLTGDATAAHFTVPPRWVRTPSRPYR